MVYIRPLSCTVDRGLLANALQTAFLHLLYHSMPRLHGVTAGVSRLEGCVYTGEFPEFKLTRRRCNRHDLTISYAGADFPRVQWVQLLQAGKRGNGLSGRGAPRITQSQQ